MAKKPATAAKKAHDPMAAAVADGWKPHPDSTGFHYKGQDVRKDADVAALYPEKLADASTPASGGNGGGDNTTPAPESPPAAQNTPEQAVASAPPGETPSEVTDQITPTGANPSEQVEDATDQIDPETVIESDGNLVNGGVPEGERPSEVTDQVTPVGTDVALARHLGEQVADNRDAAMAARELMADFSDEEHREVEQHLNAEAIAIINRIAKGREARANAANMVDGNRHYGTAVSGG